MLVLTRKPSESIIINDNVVVEVIEVRGDKVKLGITAPKSVPVHRQEVWAKIKEVSGANNPFTVCTST